MYRIRRCIFRPYRKGYGPVFTLDLYSTDRTDWRGQTRIAYRLLMGGALLFSGDDYSPSPLHSLDSDAAVAGLMDFLTLRPGDTDPEFFEGYSPRQLAYCQDHAESLSAEISARFGEAGV